jgi:hypothetical protein
MYHIVHVQTIDDPVVIYALHEHQR